MITKDQQIRLVGTKDFAYATGSTYTQGHVHFTTDEHGSIIVNGKVYGTTDASYIYVGSENIPTYVDAKINSLNGKAAAGTGNFITYVQQAKGNITAYQNTLEKLVTAYNADDDQAYKEGPNDKFITNVEITGDTIYAYWDNFSQRVQALIPSLSVEDAVDGSSYSSKVSVNGHKITIEKGSYLTTYSDFYNLKKVVDKFFSGAELDTASVTSYIDTLAEIQTAFKNSYAETISNSIKDVIYKGASNGDNSYTTWVTYTTNGGTSYTAYLDIPSATNTVGGLVKYDNNTIKKDSSGKLYVNGKLTDTQYFLHGDGRGNNAYIQLVNLTDGQGYEPINFAGTGIATVLYNSTNKVIEINVPETVVNYNHHSTGNGTNNGNVVLDSEGTATTNKVISSVSLSAAGKLEYSYVTLKHETIFTGGGSLFVGPYNDKLLNGSIIVPKLTVNNCGHLTAYENVTISGIAAEDHSHDEFVWL